MRARSGKFAKGISDEGAPQGISCAAGPDEGGARPAGADTYNPTGQQPNVVDKIGPGGGGALRSRHWPHSRPRQRTPDPGGQVLPVGVADVLRTGVEAMRLDD